MEAAAAPSNQCPPEHPDWVDRLRHGGSVPVSSLQDPPPNSWACPPGSLFSVRGPDYMKTMAKIAGGECLLQPLAFDLLQGPCRISHIMKHPAQCRVRAALDAAIRAADPHDCQHEPFVWVFNLQLGTKAHHSSVYYFVSFGTPPQGSLAQRFLDGDDAFRNARLKLLLRLPEAPWLVQVVVGERWPVCLLGKAFPCTYIREKHYIEVDVDVGSSTLARTGVNLFSGLGSLVVSDMAFVLEGIDPDELPETILGAIRHVKVEPSSAVPLDMLEGPPGATLMSKGFKAKFMKFLKSSSNDAKSPTNQEQEER